VQLDLQDSAICPIVTVNKKAEIGVEKPFSVEV